MQRDRLAGARVIRLHGYWRSSASYRVRIALEIKGLTYEQIAYDLRTGEQNSQAYRSVNPQGLVPALEVDGLVLTQSTAILEWLEDRNPEPPLLPVGDDDRAIVRAMAAVIACDIHPLNNLRVLNALREGGVSEPARKKWIRTWIADGFSALEWLIERHGNGFAFGARPTFADCHLVPQFYNAERYGVEVWRYPRLLSAVQRAVALPAFAAAHPDMYSISDGRQAAKHRRKLTSSFNSDNNPDFKKAPERGPERASSITTH